VSAGSGVARRPAARGLRPAAATALAVVAALLAAAVLPLTVLAHQGLLANVTQLLVVVPILAVGFIVARRQPGNPIGWLLLAVPAGVLVSLDAAPYAVLVYRLGYHLPLGPAAVLLEAAYLPALLLGLPPVFLLFPDGVLPSPRWRWVLWSYLVLAACLVAAAFAAAASVMISHGIRIDAGGGLTAVDHPTAQTAWLSRAGLLIFPLLAFWLVFAGRLAASWRHADGDRRQQLKWLMSGVAVAVAGTVVSNLVPALDPAATAVGVGAVLPVCIGVAILRYRLYDIDRIISRTLAYAIVTGLLVGVYAGLVLLATGVLSVHGPVAVAAATLAAAALFSPLRRRVQKLVDRRFNRARYDADKIVAGFAGRLKDAVDLDSVRDDLAAVVCQALEPAHLSVWVSGRD